MSLKSFAAPFAMALFFGLLSSAGRADAPKEDQEPPQTFFIEAGDKKIPVDLGQPFPTAEFAGKATATLRVDPHRTFRYAELVFQYPQEFVFEADLENEAVSIWSLSGSNSVIMVQKYPGRKDADEVRKEVVRAMGDQYQEALKSQSAVALPLKSGNLQGVRLNVELAGSPLVQDLFSFTAGDCAIILLLQDSPQENKQPSAEHAKAQKMLTDSLSVPAK